jgi:hypothetical protein
VSRCTACATLALRFGGTVFTKSRLPKHMLKTLGSALGATELDTWHKNKLKDFCKGAKVCGCARLLFRYMCVCACVPRSHPSLHSPPLQEQAQSGTSAREHRGVCACARVRVYIRLLHAYVLVRRAVPLLHFCRHPCDDISTRAVMPRSVALHSLDPSIHLTLPLHRTPLIRSTALCSFHTHTFKLAEVN